MRTRQEEIRSLKQYLLMLALVEEIEMDNGHPGEEWIREARFHRNNIEERLKMFENLPGEVASWPLHERLRYLAIQMDSKVEGRDPEITDLILAADVLRDYEGLTTKTGHMYDDRLEGRVDAAI